MIPVTQSKVLVKTENGKIVQHGNCWAAAIASILELPLSEVPNFEIWFDTPWNYLWDELTHAFLISRGFVLEYDNRFRVFHKTKEEWDTGVDNWGRAFVEFGVYDELKLGLMDHYYFISGLSPRGVNHVTIWKNGIMVHDPHPTREGINELNRFEVIRPITDEERKLALDYDNNRMVAFPNIRLKSP